MACIDGVIADIGGEHGMAASGQLRQSLLDTLGLNVNAGNLRAGGREAKRQSLAQAAAGAGD